MGNFLCCFPRQTKEELNNSYKVLADEPDENLNVKSATITDQTNAEQKTASKEVVESKQGSSNEVLKPEEAKVNEVLKSNQVIGNVAAQAIVEKPSGAVIDKVSSGDVKVTDQANDKGAVEESKAEIKTEKGSENEDGEAEKNKVIEKKDDVRDILDEALGEAMGKFLDNSPQENSDKLQQSKDYGQKVSAQKSETFSTENENVKPVNQSIKLNNISRAVVKKTQEEEAKNVTNKPE